MLLFANKVTTEFASKVREISARLGVNPNWLMLLMKHESNLNPAVRNSIGAVGLIQFLPSTAAALGTSTGALQSMSATKQLDYVEKFFRPYKGKMHSYQDMHLAAFFPAALSMKNSEVLSVGGSASIVAKQNKPFDLNSNGSITVAEAKKYFTRNIEKSVPHELKDKFKSTPMKHLDLIKASLLIIVAGLAMYSAIKSYN